MDRVYLFTRDDCGRAHLRECYRLDYGQSDRFIAPLPRQERGRPNG